MLKKDINFNYKIFANIIYLLEALVFYIINTGIGFTASYFLYDIKANIV